MMISIPRMLLLSAALMAAPMAGAMAQSNPAGNYGTSNAATATLGTAGNPAASGMNTGDMGARNTTGNNLGMTSNTPGAPSAHANSGLSTYNSNTTSLPPTAHSQTGGGGMGGGAGSSK
jgi:hypothetical protein